MPKRNLWIHDNARNESKDELESLRVNRADELRLLSNTLKFSEGNVFLYGPRGVGKTFLLRILERDLRSDSEEIFPFWFPISIQIGHMVEKHPDKSVFPIAFMFEMLSCAWNTLGGYRHSDLFLNNLIEDRSRQIENDQHEYMKQLAIALLGPEEKSHYKRSSTLGASAIVKGEIKEDWGMERCVSDAFLQNIYKHLQEFKDVVLEKFGIKKVVALCDEANLMPGEWQKHIITHHLQLFADYKVQFVFVADFVPGLNEVNIPDYFDVNINLEGLSHPDITDMVKKRYHSIGYHFDDEAVKSIANESNGNPRDAIIVSNLALSNIEDDSATKISLEATEIAIRKYRQQRESVLKEARKNSRGQEPFQTTSP